jgi:hypothetical protein
MFNQPDGHSFLLKNVEGMIRNEVCGSIEAGKGQKDSMYLQFACVAVK